MNKGAKDQTKVAALNAFAALYDSDSGDDTLNNAVKQLERVSIGSKPDNAENGNEKEGSFVQANNRNSRGGYTNNLRYQNRGTGQIGRSGNHTDTYQNGWYRGNGRRSSSRSSNGTEDDKSSVKSERGGSHSRGGTYRNGWYRGNAGRSSSRSSTGTRDGASDKAEKSSVKSEREQREEEFQQKLKEFEYDAQKEEIMRKFIAKSKDALPEKDKAIQKFEALSKEEKEKNEGEVSKATSEKLLKALEEKEQLLKERIEAIEYCKLSDRKKMTLAEYEKIKEESRKALQISNGEKRVVKESEFDGMVVIAKKNSEESLSIKPTKEAEKMQKGEKKKKKFIPLVTITGSQSQQERPRYGGGPHKYRSIEQNTVATSPNLGSAELFPSLCSAPSA